MKIQKHSQLKIQQMAFMLMAVFIFFVLVGLFYVVIQGQSWRQEALIVEKNNAIGLANMLSGNAEFSCGAYCIDADRVMVLAKRNAYQDFFGGIESMEIRTLYPKSSKEILCTDSSYPDCNLIKIIESGEGARTASTFISLCKRVNEEGYISYKCELGKLIIGYNV